MMLSSTEMAGEQIIIHNNAHSMIWKEPGGGIFVIRHIIFINCDANLTCRLFVYYNIVMFAHAPWNP